MKPDTASWRRQSWCAQTAMTRQSCCCHPLVGRRLSRVRSLATCQARELGLAAQVISESLLVLDPAACEPVLPAALSLLRQGLMESSSPSGQPASQPASQQARVSQ